MTIPYGCVMTRYGVKRLTPKAWIRWQIRQHNAQVATAKQGQSEDKGSDRPGNQSQRGRDR